MAHLFVYNNALWREIHRFEYTGTSQKFTLTPGRYLIACHGAQGGKNFMASDTTSNNNNGIINYGGSAYGILNVTENKELCAVVGGNGTNGESGGNKLPGFGGFNGGADGGRRYNDNSSYYQGAGGGGASDVRINSPEDFDEDHLLYIPTIPPEYQQLEYFDNRNGAYFDTGYVAKSNTTFVFGAKITRYSNAVSSSMCFLSNQSGNNTNPGWGVWLDAYAAGTGQVPPRLTSVYGEQSDQVPYTIGVSVDDKAVYRIDKNGTFVNDVPLEYNYNASGSPNDQSIILFALKRNNSYIANNYWKGFFYFLQIYEESNGAFTLVHEFIPVVRVSDNVVGLYDTVAGDFRTQVNTSTAILPGPRGSFHIKNHNIQPRYIPTLPEGYTQIQYIESDGSDAQRYFFRTNYNMKSSSNTTEICTCVSKDTPSDNFSESLFGTYSADESSGWHANLSYDSSDVSANGRMKVSSYSGNFNGPGVRSPLAGYIDYGPSANHGFDIPIQYTFNIERLCVSCAPISTLNASDLQDASVLTPSPPLVLGASVSGPIPDQVEEPTSWHLEYDQFLKGHRFYYARIYEAHTTSDGDVQHNLVHEYIPCIRDDDNQLGVYDTQAEEFILPVFTESEVCDDSGVVNPSDRNDSTITTLTAGPTGPVPIGGYTGAPFGDEPYVAYNKKSLKTRIIVAGGGGGGAAYSSGNGSNPISCDTIFDYAGIGGGVVGGCLSLLKTSDDPSQDERMFYADQEHGYAFGYGEVAADKTVSYGWTVHGSGGGGGGWYGGFAIQTMGDYASGNGGGGSGYVLTADNDTQGLLDYRLTNPTLIGGSAIDPRISIYVETSSLETGDILEQYPTGRTESAFFPVGEYNFTCYGGDGGTNQHVKFSARGGIASGTLSLREPTELFFSVGGDGLFDSLINQQYVRQLRPHFGFNGGGLPSNWNYDVKKGHAGGGATDIRILENSLMSRVLVAGGAGGRTHNNFGGDGGGTNGGNCAGSYGVNPGPGTQTSSPVDTTYPYLSGGFGYGGNAVEIDASTGKFGGAGGSGWYGGGATQPDANRDNSQRSGSGGSGFTYTESSTVPPEWLLNNQYYLTNVSMTNGGNNLPRYHTAISMTVVDASELKLLCRDMYGIKYYDRGRDMWTLTPSQELNVSLFRTYGSLAIISDNGLDDEFEVLVYDPNDITDTFSLYVTPNKQTVTHVMNSDIKIRHTSVGADCDPRLFEMNILTKRSTETGTTIITTKVELDKLDKETVQKPHLYYVTYSE